MSYVVMQKLDGMTAWHSLREYADRQSAQWQVMLWERQRGEAKYPKYAIEPVSH